MEKLKKMSIKQKLIILFSLLTLVLVGIILLVPRNSKIVIAKLSNNFNADGEEITAFVITVRDANDNSIVLSNSRFIIKELTIVNDVEYESDPLDIYGNVLGTEEVVNGETVRVFETDENGVIEANFRDGNYKIEQIEAKDGYKVSAVQYFGVNAERGSNVELVSEEPLYTGNTDANSTPDSFCVEGRSDGSALYYNVGYLSYVDSTNQVVWTEYSDLVYEIIARDDGFDVLTDSQIVQYDNSGNITNTIEVAYGMRSFKKDANGNFVITGTFYGSLSIDSSLTTSGSSITLSSTSYTDDMYVLTLDSNNLVSSAYSIEGDYSEVPRTIAITTDGNYVISYVVDTYEYNIVKVNSLTGATIATVETDISGRSYDLVHYVAAGEDGSVYYGGNYSGTVTYTADETASGIAISLTANDEDGIVIKYDSNMKILWAINLGGAGGDHFFKADTTDDGGFVMGGDSDTGTITIAAENSQSGYSITSTPESTNVGTWRGITVKVNSDGKVVWAKEFGFSSNEGMYAITTFTNDSFALCGFETANSTRNAVLIRVNEEVIEEEIEAMTSLEVYNEPITYAITTEVNGEGGTISGQDDTVYETVDWNADATKEIVVTANTGYVIKSITIQKTDDEGTVTTENVTIDEELKTYTIAPFTNLNENIHVIAEFEKLEAKVIVHHYITGTTTQVPGRYSGTVADEEYIGTVGDTYTTEAASTSEISRYYSLSGTPDNATGTYIEGTIEVIYYYDPTNYNYTIYYYYDGTEDTSKRETLQAGYGTQVIDYPDKAGIGYKLDSTTNVPLTITASTYSNRMRIYYVTDEEQRKYLSYTVEYYKDGNIVSADTQTVTENVQVLEADTLTVDKTTINTTDKYEGYTLESTSPTTIPDTINSGEIIKVYYVKRTDLSYTVNYYEEGTTTKVAESKMVDNQTFETQVTENAIDVAGYNKVGETESTITIKVSGNEINFYYAKRTDLSYTVKYLEQGTDLELASTKTVNNQTYKSTVEEKAIDIEGYDKVEPTSANITIEETGNEIIFYYTKRTDLSYTVKYLEQNTNAVLSTEKVVKGQTYKSTVTENAIEISGYDKVAPTEQTITIEVTGNEIIFYYTKRVDLSYTVKYLEKDTDTVLSTEKIVNGQTYKSEVTENAIEISGYDKVDPTEKTTTIEVTGNEIVFYYTRRTDLSYTVKYLEQGTDAELAGEKTVNGQTYKSEVTEQAIDITGYTKVNSEEKITIEVSGNEITFYYKKVEGLSYTVNYYEKGTTTSVANSKTVDEKVFEDIVTESAIDVEGYNKENPTEQTITIGVGENIINFYYTKRTDLSYIVNYYEEGTTTTVAESKTVNNRTFKETITESAIDVEGYNKVNTEESIVIEVENNVINFYYTKRVDLNYTVKYLEQESNSELATTKTVNNQTYKSIVTENAIEISGYNKVNPTEETITIEVTGNEIIFYYTKRTDLSYTVKYLEQGTNAELSTSKTVNGQTYKSEVTEEAIEISGYDKVDPTEKTITIGVTGNEIVFYYTKRTDLSYTVKYLEEGTNAVLSTEKVVGGQTYKATATEEAIDITGYDKVDSTESTITIEVAGNEIIFYYTKRTDLSYTVKYLEQDTNKELSTEKIVTDQTFKLEVTEQAIDITGYTKVKTEETITIEVSGNEIIFYYKKVEGLSYIVNYYEDGTTTSVATSKTVDGKTFEEEVAENAIDVEGYNKINPTEQTITIGVGENIINFYYTKRTDLSYTVKYLEQGTNAELSTSKTVNGQTYKSEVTEEAIEISGYDRVEPTEKAITIEVTGNEINFYYTKRTDLSYTVKYLEKDTNVELSNEKVVDGQTYKATATEEAIEISGYDRVEPTEKAITIEVTGNEIIFYYTKRADLSYTVKYLEEGTNAVLSTEKVVGGQTYKATATEEAIDITGYDRVEPTEKTITIEVTGNEIIFYYTKRTDLSYTVKYLEQDTNKELSTSKTVNGQTYKSEVTEEAIEISGYDKVDPTEKTITIGVTGNEIVFYYTKRTDLSYTVKYLEEGTNAVLSTEKVVGGQTYKATATEEAIEISGYDKVDPTQKSITIEVTGNEIVFYYTKRTDLSYTVKYLEQGTDKVLSEEKNVENKLYKESVRETAIDIEGYTKVNQEETITIEVSGNEIIFYYKKVEGLSYIVNYYEDGTTTSVATSKTVDGKTFEEEVAENAIDVEGYNKAGQTEKTITIGVGENVINFYYTKRTDLSYTVKYLEEGSNAVLATEKTVNGQTYKSTAREEAIDISGYDKAEPTEKSITIEVTGNEIIFYYTKRTDLSYTVKYLEQGTDRVLADEKVVNGQIYKSTVTENAVDVVGFTKVNTQETITIEVNGNEIIFYYKKVEGLSYTVNYYENGTDKKISESKIVDGKTFEEQVTESAIDVEGYDKEEPTEKTITIGVGENVINFYYTKRTDLSYTVKYLEKDTNTILSNEKVVTDQTFKTEVTEQAIEISGYDKTNLEETIIIEVTGNEIVFYYTKRTDLSYTVRYLEEGSNEVLSAEKVVNGQTYKSTAREESIEISGYDKTNLEETITIEVTGNEIVFYYTKRTDLSYTVKYLEKDTNVDLSNEKVVDGQIYKSEVKEEAIEISGYDKTNLEETITIEVSGNEIIFYYTKRTDLSYTVKYLEKNTNAELSNEKVVNGQTYKSEVKEEAIEISGYDKTNLEETITIEVSGNEIIFYYTKRTDLSYTVKYLEQETGRVLSEEKVVDGLTYKSEVTENSIDIVGFTKVNTQETITIEVTGNEIIFYYKKVEGLAYTVNYLEQGTNKVVAPSKNIDGKTFEENVTEKAIDIEGYDKVNPIETSIVIGVGENIINFYYTKRVDLSYTVKYLEQGSNIELSLTKTVDGKTFEEQITENARDIEGYDKVGDTEKTITMAVSGNEIIFYYTKRTDLSYTVKYLEQDSNEVLLTEKVVNGKTFQEVITEQSVDISGYNKVNLEETIIMEVTGNEIIFYYTKKTDIEYKVEFYYDGVLDESKTEIHQGTFKGIVDTYTDNVILGYKLNEEINFPLEIGANSADNIIQIHYVIDDAQTKDITYTVEYYKEGTLIDIDTQVNTKTVQILEPDTLDVNKDDINIVDKYFGYRLDTTEPNVIPEQVNNGDVIRVYYVIDEGNTKKLTYTVEYYKEGVLVEDDTQTVSETVQILQPDTLDVRKGEINTLNKYIGYKLEETTPSIIPDKIATGETIKVYYVIDENQRKDLSYTIEYYKDGILQPEETKEVSINVQLLKPDTIPVDKAEMVLSGKYVGYRLEKTSPSEIPTIANNGDVIRIYYIKDQFNYTVEYYYDGKIDNTKTDVFTATYDDVITEYTDKNIFGYRLEKTEKLPLKVSEKTEENVIKVYYIIDDGNTKTLNYTVEYYMDGVLQEGDTQIEYKTVQVLQPDTFEVDKSKINLVDKYVGYKLDKLEPTVIPDVATTGDVYKVYYIKNIFGYTIEYYYEGQLDSSKTENLVATFGDVIEEYPDKNNGKYYLDYTENFPMRVSNNENDNVIKVHYEKKLSTITVHYYWDGINNTNNNADKDKTTLGEDDENNQESQRVSVSQDVIIEDKVDTVHKISAATDILDKYELVSKPENEEITMTVEPQEFEYIYRLKNAKVVVNFINQLTGQILATEIIEGQVDDMYHAVPRDMPGFGFKHDEIPVNEVGKMTLEPITVNFYYQPSPQGEPPAAVVTPGEKHDFKGRGPATGDSIIIVSMMAVVAFMAININQGNALKINIKGGKRTRKETIVGKHNTAKKPARVARMEKTSRIEKACKRQRKH